MIVQQESSNASKAMQPSFLVPESKKVSRDLHASFVIDRNQLIPNIFQNSPQVDNFYNKISEIDIDAQVQSQRTVFQGQVSQLLMSTDRRNTQIQTVRAKLAKLNQIVGVLDMQRIHLVDFVESLAFSVRIIFKNWQAQWETLRQPKGLQEAFGQQKNKNQKLVKELQQSNKKKSQLQKQKADLYEKLTNLSKQYEFLSQKLFENQQAQSQAQSGKVQQLQNQLMQLNKSLQQQSQYIFDLEQRVANHQYELQQCQKKAKNSYENSLKQQRKAIETDLRTQIEAAQLQMQTSFIQQLEQQLAKRIHGMKQEYQVEIQESQNDMKRVQMQAEEEAQIYQAKIHQLTSQIGQLQAQEERLNELNHQLKIKIKLLEQQINPMNMSPLELKVKEMELQLAQKEKLIQQLKQLSIKPPNSLLFVRDKPEASISPSSANFSHNKNQVIDRILSRIKMKQSSILLNESVDKYKPSSRSKNKGSTILMSNDSIVLDREKDARMQNISQKLSRLRAEIRQELTLPKNRK